MAQLMDGDLGTAIKLEWISDEDEFHNFCKTLGKKYAKKIYRKAMRQVAYKLRETMIAHSPHLTGALDASMIVRKPKGFKAKRGSIVYGAVVSGDKLMSLTGREYPYYLAIEYGTRRSAPDPFLRPAVAIVKPLARGIFLEESKRILNSELPRGVKG